MCVSCGPGNADYEGNAEFARSGTTGAADGPPVGISDNGEYVFFDTQARLVPQAENHTLDVYEWHEDPVSHAATVSLLSSPTDPFPSFFLGSSPYEYTNAGGEHVKLEGGNVFIGTHGNLVPQDTNSAGNIYDVRICQSQSPCIKPPPPPPLQCEGGTCQTPGVAPADPPATLLAPPVGGQPNSLTAETKGKVTTGTSPKCRKGFVKRKVKKREVCVRKPKKRARAKRAGNNGRPKR